MRFRLRTLLIVAWLLPVPIAMLSADFLTLPLWNSDKTEAARNLITWVVEDSPLPGSGEQANDAHFFRDKKSFLVTCDFLPLDTRLSNDPRVRYVTREEFKAAIENADFATTVYIDLGLKSESSRLFTIEFTYQYGNLGAQGYRFEFRRKAWGLRARGKHLWVS
jgi:hypothetical protein